MALVTGPMSLDALSSLEQQGLAAPEKPNYDIPKLPSDLTELGDEDLMVLYSKLTAYADFVAVQVSCAHVDERFGEKRLAALEASKMLKGDNPSDNKVTFARAQVAIDPEVVALKEQLEKLYAYRKLIEALNNNIERDSALVSRELTRRTSNSNRRSNRWSA